MRTSTLLLTALAALLLVNVCASTEGKWGDDHGDQSASATAAAAISQSGLSGGSAAPSILEQISTHELAGLAILNQKFLVNIAGWLSFISDSVYGSSAPAGGASAAAAASAGRRLLVASSAPASDAGAEELVRSLGGTPEELAAFIASLKTNLNALYGL